LLPKTPKPQTHSLKIKCFRMIYHLKIKEKQKACKRFCSQSQLVMERRAFAGFVRHTK